MCELSRSHAGLVKFLWLCQEQVGTAWGMRSGLRPCEVPPCEYSVCGMPLRAATGGGQSPNLSQQVVMLARRAMCASAGWQCSPPAPRSARGTVGRFEYLTRRSAVFKVFAIGHAAYHSSVFLYYKSHKVEHDRTRRFSLSAETSEARLGSSSCLSPLHLSSAVSAHHTDLSMRCYRQQVGVGGSHVGTVALGPNFGQFCLLSPLWSTGSTASCSSRASQRTKLVHTTLQPEPISIILT